MGDERLTVEEVGEIDGRPGVLLRGSQEAVKRAVALFGEPVAIVPLEGEGFEAAVERAARAMGDGYACKFDGLPEEPTQPKLAVPGTHGMSQEVLRENAELAIRAALTPGDTNG